MELEAFLAKWWRNEGSERANKDSFLNDLCAVLGVEPGSVSPLAAMNDTGLTTTVVIDAALMSADIVNVHTMVNVATLGMRPATLVEFLRRHGHEPQIVDLDE